MSSTTVVISIPGGITLTITTPAAAAAADAQVIAAQPSVEVRQAPAPAPGRARPASPPGFVDHAAMLEENRRLLSQAEPPIDTPDEVGEPIEFDPGEDEEVQEDVAPPPGRGRQVTPAEAFALVAGGSDAPRGPRGAGVPLDRRIAARLRTGGEAPPPAEGFAPPFSRTPKK